MFLFTHIKFYNTLLCYAVGNPMYLTTIAASSSANRSVNFDFGGL